MLSDEEKQEYEELKSLLYTGTISQYGKRKLIEIIEKQSKEIERINEILTWKQKHEEQLQKEIEELKKENLEIRDWKYVIDSPIDLDKLKELDLIKIKGKEYISKRIYNELEKDKKALVNNYSKVLGEFIPKDKIKAKIEELEKLDFGTDLVSQFTANLTTITILQSLLEKE